MSYRPNAAISLILSKEGQALLGSRTFCQIFPNTSSTVGFQGIGSTTNVGTVTTPAFASGAYSTERPRMVITSSTSVNSVAGSQVNGLQFSRARGFRLTFVFATLSATAAQRTFCGMQSTNTSSASSPFNLGTTEPSSMVDCVGVAYDHAETTLHIQHNDGSGTCTRVDLGVNFPVDATSVYQCEFWVAPGDTTIYYKVTRMNDGTQAEGTITTNLVTSSTPLAPQLQTSNGGTGGTAVVMAIYGLYCQTPL